MSWKLHRVFGIMTFACAAFCVSALSQYRVSKPEETEWTWEVRPAHVDPKLPNVLLVGDSITRNYYPEVQKELANQANVYLFAASTSVGDPRLPRELLEFAKMEAVSFKIVHFNNGMHGWKYSEKEYRGGFSEYLRILHKIAPKAQLIWASTTPVKVDDTPGPTNARIRERNKIALSFTAPASILLDDEYALMVDHADQYEDHVHFNSAGAAVQGAQVTQRILELLGKR